MPDNGAYVDEYRAWLRRYNGGEWARHADRSNVELATFIDRAKTRIGRRRQSWHIVAAQMMEDEPS
jgi:hypothetical protein